MRYLPIAGLVDARMTWTLAIEGLVIDVAHSLAKVLFFEDVAEVTTKGI